MKTYKTAQIAEIIGVHPNTIRMYEALELIPEAERQSNGYRVFTDFHVAQMLLARAAFQVEILQNGLRKKAVAIVKLSAKGQFAEAIAGTEDYLHQLNEEQRNAEEAIAIVTSLLNGSSEEKEVYMRRKEVSEYLSISIDTLRNWELNGLLKVKRKKNGYRVYTNEDIRYLKVIRALRCANYSLAAILRMLNALSENPEIDIKKAINSAEEEEDIITACDHLLVSLESARINAKKMRTALVSMKELY